MKSNICDFNRSFRLCTNVNLCWPSCTATTRPTRSIHPGEAVKFPPSTVQNKKKTGWETSDWEASSQSQRLNAVFAAHLDVSDASLDLLNITTFCCPNPSVINHFKCQRGRAGGVAVINPPFCLFCPIITECFYPELSIYDPQSDPRQQSDVETRTSVWWIKWSRGEKKEEASSQWSLNPVLIMW